MISDTAALIAKYFWQSTYLVMRRLLATVVAALFVIHSSAQAATVEAEPNNSCPSAQLLGSAADGTVNGALTYGDVDFFIITGLKPGATQDIKLGGSNNSPSSEALENPYLGVFSSTCTPLGENDNYDSPDARLLIQTPSDGVLIIGVTSCCDADFSGSTMAGDYQVTVSEYLLPPKISGVVRNADGDPVFSGEVAVFRCDPVDLDICSNYQNSATIRSADGGFDFNTYGLEVGTTYQLLVQDDHQSYPSKYFTPFTLGETDLYFDLQLDPVFVTVEPLNIPSSISTGSTAEFTVRLTSHAAQPLIVDSRLIISAVVTGSPFGTSQFQTATSGDPTPVRTTLMPEMPTVVTLQFATSTQANAGAVVTVALAVSLADQAMTMYVNQPIATFSVKSNEQVLLMSGAELQRRLYIESKRQSRPPLTLTRPRKPQG